MKRTSTGIAVAATIAVASCATPEPVRMQIGESFSRSDCVTDRRDWRVVAAPENADEYRASAMAENPKRSKKFNDDEWGHYTLETWAGLPTGEVILCLSDQPPPEAWGIEYWQFKANSTEIADSGMTIIVG